MMYVLPALLVRCFMPCMGRVVITIKRSSEHTAGLVLRKSVIVAISNPSD